MSSRGELARQNILDAAARAFARYGFEGTRLDRIAGGLGVTRQALLFHFKDKRGLYDAVLERLFTEREQGLDSRGREEFASLAEYVDYLVAYSVQYFLQNPEYVALLLRLLIAEGPTATEPPSSGKGMVARWEEVLEEGLRAGEIHPVPVSNLVALVGGTLSYYLLLPEGARTGANLMAYDPRAKTEVEAITRNLQQAVRGMLGL